MNYYPILIEYKGKKYNLVKLVDNGQVCNKTKDNEHHFKNIISYAVNGAVYYANALINYTSYTDIISISITGLKNDRVCLVAVSIIAVIGISEKVAPLKKSDLKSSSKKGTSDGDIIIRKIKEFLNEKKLSEDKKELIIKTLHMLNFKQYIIYIGYFSVNILESVLLFYMVLIIFISSLKLKKLYIFSFSIIF